MTYTVYDMRAYYQTRPGNLARRMVADYLRRLWTAQDGLRVVGYGYAPPYLPLFEAGTERSIALVPAALGIHAWPDGGLGRVALCDEAEWPLETESVDRILMVHALEHADHADAVMREAWRVLRSNGRMLMVVPHRMGLWARADWTPFGHGRPFTSGQLRQSIQDALFVRERSEKALFVPPFQSFALMRSAWQFEAVGRTLLSGLAGVFIVEVSKQLYAGKTVRVVKTGQRRPIFLADPVTG